MKNYNSYMERQSISPEAHEALLNLKPGKRRSARPWVRYGALAACAALIIGAGMWRLTSFPPDSQTAQNALYPGIKDCYGPGETPPDTGDHPLATDKDSTGTADFHGFTVDSPAAEQYMNFYAMPAIRYPDITNRYEVDMALDWAYAQGSFRVELEKEDIQRVFWGSEGKPETADGDLPWALFWDGYTLRGHVWYNPEGKLLNLYLAGEKSGDSFTLELCPGSMPPTCCIDMNQGDVISDVFGVSVAGWSKVFGRNNDHYICGSEFMTKSDIGVRFQSGGGSLEDTARFNTLFVRQALTEDGGLYLDHLATAEHIPAWRDETFSTLAQARQEADFAPYLPKSDPEGYEEFFGHLTYQEDRENTLHVGWSGHYNSVIINIYREDTYSYNLVSPDEPELYDLRLYPVPWCDSVPEEYHETVDRPAFRAEDMSLDIVEARWNENDTGGRIYSFDVLHPDGTVVFYRCGGMTAEQVWALVEPTL